MKAKDIAFGGIMVALTLITLYLTIILPINTLSLLTIASCFIPITIMKSNIKTAIFVYISSTMLSFFILPINYVILYGGFFGIYGVIKFFIEKLKKLPLEIILKLLVCNFVLIIGLLFADIILVDVKTSLPIWQLYILAQPIFFLYDYGLSLIIDFVYTKFRRFLS